MKRTILFAAAMALTLVACTTASENDEVRGIAKYEGDPRLGEEVDKICFTRNIDGFTGATKDTIILESVNKEYIVEVERNCYNLRNAMGVTLDTGLSCLSKFDHIVVYDTLVGGPAAGPGPDRCAIKSINKWDGKAKAVTEIADG